MIKYIFILFAWALLVACGDDLAELNNNPNSSNVGSSPELFTAATGFYGVGMDAYFNEDDAILAQYWAGGPGVALIDNERYFYEPADFNNEWSFSYLQALSDLDYVIDNGNEALASMANILSVHIYQNLVDHYGDVPYSNSLNGDPSDGGVIAPTYDDGKAIYADLISRLDSSVMVLSNTTAVVGEEDLIYSGNTAAWVTFANSLKLRLLMRQSITDPSVGPAVMAVINNGNLIDSETDMAVISFTGGTGNYNPQFARREAGIGQFYVASQTSVDVLNDLNDPRDIVIYDVAEATGNVVGLPQGAIRDFFTSGNEDFSYPSEVAYSESNGVILMSNWEVYFLRAEAALRFGTSENEVTMFENAVTSHFTYIGLTESDASAYLSTEVEYSTGLSVQDRSDIIGVQKWISMNGLQESEGWVESRRFDTPGSNVFTEEIFQTPKETVLGTGTFPSIRLYPQTELSFNADNTPTGRTLMDKVFWDN